MTNTLKPVLRVLGSKVASIGRVQSCLLYLIYLRARNPEIYFSAVLGYCSHRGCLWDSHCGPPTKIIHSRTRRLRIVSMGKYIMQPKHCCKPLIQNRFQNRPPAPLNTTKALVITHAPLGHPSGCCPEDNGRIYLDQLLSYPRTESDIYPNDYDHIPVLQKLVSHSIYGKFARQILDQGVPTQLGGALMPATTFPSRQLIQRNPRPPA